MTTEPFKALGEQSRWKIVYDRLCRKDIGETITYEEMGSHLDLDPRRDRHIIQAALRRAAAEYLEKDLRALESVRGVGYVVVRPAEQMRLARSRTNKAKNQLVSAHSLVVHVDQNDMSLEMAGMFMTAAIGIANQLEVNRRQDKKNRVFEQALADAAVRQERTEEDVSDIRRRMADLEAKLSERDTQQG